MKAKIVTLPGDGIGPDVVAEGLKALQAVAGRYGHTFSFEEKLIGGVAIAATGSPLPVDTLTACKQADAVFLGAVGDPRYDDPRLSVRPEQGLLALRKEMEVFANLRPVKLFPQLLHASTIKPDVIKDVAAGKAIGTRFPRWR